MSFKYFVSLNLIMMKHFLGGYINFVFQSQQLNRLHKMTKKYVDLPLNLDCRLSRFWMVTLAAWSVWKKSDCHFFEKLFLMKNSLVQRSTTHPRTGMSIDLTGWFGFWDQSPFPCLFRQFWWSKSWPLGYLNLRFHTFSVKTRRWYCQILYQLMLTCEIRVRAAKQHIRGGKRRRGSSWNKRKTMFLNLCT